MFRRLFLKSGLFSLVPFGAAIPRQTATRKFVEIIDAIWESDFLFRQVHCSNQFSKDDPYRKVPPHAVRVEELSEMRGYRFSLIYWRDDEVLGLHAYDLTGFVPRHFDLATATTIAGELGHLKHAEGVQIHPWRGSPVGFSLNDSAAK